ncbi:MAG: ATP-binding cassette domain-containing protein [Bacilli bacterium]|nr:ATP-binding cassette domain-containing protein [Bacilli bacterium]
MSIEIKNLSFKYNNDSEDVLKNISFTINDGEWVSIIGHNGSGKSTLSKLLIGILETKKGNIYIDNTLVTNETSYDLRKSIAMVFQNPDNQFVASSLEDDIAFGLENLEVDPKDMREIIEQSLSKVSMLEYIDRSPEDLSGGQRQRAAIAATLATNPKTIITITHDMREALNSDRIIVLNGGTIVKDDSAINVMNDIDILKDSGLEMPNELYLYRKLKENNYKNEEVLKALWQLISSK